MSDTPIYDALVAEQRDPTHADALARPEHGESDDQGETTDNV